MEKIFVIGYENELHGAYKTLSSAIEAIIMEICNDGCEFEFITELVENEIITQKQADLLEDLDDKELYNYFLTSKAIHDYLEDNTVVLDRYFIDELPVF